MPLVFVILSGSASSANKRGGNSLHKPGLDAHRTQSARDRWHSRAADIFSDVKGGTGLPRMHRALRPLMPSTVLQVEQTAMMSMLDLQGPPRPLHQPNIGGHTATAVPALRLKVPRQTGHMTRALVNSRNSRRGCLGATASPNGGAFNGPDAWMKSRTSTTDRGGVRRI